MIRMQIYLPEDLKQDLDFLAKKKKTPAAEIVRNAVKKEVGRTRNRKKLTAGATLLKIASYAGSGPKDLSMNFFDYTYGKKSSYGHLYKKKNKTN